MKIVKFERVLRVACVFALASLGLMVWSLFDPRPIPVVAGRQRRRQQDWRVRRGSGHSNPPVERNCSSTLHLSAFWKGRKYTDYERQIGGHVVDPEASATSRRWRWKQAIGRREQLPLRQAAYVSAVRSGDGYRDLEPQRLKR